jgi:acetyl-CoA carboxylase biotin carboxyl carrier protein
VATYEVKSEVTGSVWKILTAVGQKLAPGEPVMIIESMKMEIPVIAEDGGTITAFMIEEGKPVVEGQVVAIIEE